MTTRGAKPEKPYPDFPLHARADGRWCKKILGQTHYFGWWREFRDGKYVRVKDDGWEKALAQYNEQREFLEAGGRIPPLRPADGPLVKELADCLLAAAITLKRAGAAIRKTEAMLTAALQRIEEVKRQQADSRSAPPKG